MSKLQDNEQKKNPYQILYLCPHLPVMKFAKMVTKYHQERDLQMLQQVSEITGLKLTESHNLNWRQRQKFKGFGFQVGRRKYYLLPQ